MDSGGTVILAEPFVGCWSECQDGGPASSPPGPLISLVFGVALILPSAAHAMLWRRLVPPGGSLFDLDSPKKVPTSLAGKSPGSYVSGFASWGGDDVHSC